MGSGGPGKGPQILGSSPTQPPLQGRPRPAPTLGLLAPLKVLSCAGWMRPPSLWPLTRSCLSWADPWALAAVASLSEAALSWGPPWPLVAGGFQEERLPSELSEVAFGWCDGAPWVWPHHV